MSIEICRYTAESIKRWSGGTTQELYISPNSELVQNRNFDFRISTATVEEEESTFTNYQGYLRKLMVLEGELTISHQDHHSITLKSFEQDSFSGDWNSTSKGKVRDFNVIYKDHLNPTIEVRHFSSEELILTHSEQLFIYIFSGSCILNNQELQSNTGVFCTNLEDLKFQFKDKCTLIIVKFD